MSHAPAEQSVEIELAIAASDMLRYYRGDAREIVARALDGRIVCFPVRSLRAFVDAAGVHGRFRVFFDKAQRLSRIERVAPEL
jgi:hypothetical protein